MSRPKGSGMVQNPQFKTLLKEIAEKEEMTDFLVVFHGSVNQEIITSTINLLEDNCRIHQFPNRLVTKLKIVCIEILQNILKHQHKAKEIMPYFVIGSGNNIARIFSGNIINTEAKKNIVERFNVYNHLDADQLKQLYRDQLVNTPLSEAGNAGIGLMDIVYRSNRQVEYSVSDYTEGLYYFSIKVVIDYSLK